MSVLEFIAALVGSIACPLTVLIVALIIRHDLKKINNEETSQ